MQKSCVIILIYFFVSNNAFAQLPNDLAKFAQTLQNLKTKLDVVRPPLGARIITVPASGVVTFPGDNFVRAPEGSTLEIDDTGVITVKVPATGGQVVLSSNGFLKVSNNATRQFLDDGTMYYLRAGEKISLKKGRVITIVPGRVMPSLSSTVIEDTSPGGIQFLVPAAGGNIQITNNKEVFVPGGSTLLVTENDKPVVIVPATGGNVTLPAGGGYIGVTVKSDVLLPGAIDYTEVPAGKYIKIDDEGVVNVTPFGPKPRIAPSIIIKGTALAVPAGGGDVRLSTGEIVKVPAGSKVAQHKNDNIVNVILPATGGSVTLPSGGGTIGLEHGSGAAQAFFSNKTKLEIPARGYVYVPYQDTVIITPYSKPKIVSGLFAGKAVTISPDGTAKLSTGDSIKVPVGSEVSQLYDPNDAISVTLPATGGSVLLPSGGGIVGLKSGASIALFSDGTTLEVPANKYVSLDYKDVVTINPR